MVDRILLSQSYGGRRVIMEPVSIYASPFHGHRRGVYLSRVIVGLLYSNSSQTTQLVLVCRA
jgi:hypothetical protein